MSLSIENVDLTAGTLDIYMINQAGCSHCDDNQYAVQELCEVNGNNTLGGTWMFDTSIDEATCIAYDDATEVGYHGVYFDGEVGGFQFYLTGITITDVSGGTAGQYFDLLQFQPTSGKIIASSFTGAVIPAGSGVLTTITFTDPEEIICFAEQDCSSGACENTIANGNGLPIKTNWGFCYADDCEGTYDCFGICDGDAIEDECGICEGSGAIYECGCNDISEDECDCEGNVEDCTGICGGTTIIDCFGECGGSAELDECGVCGGDGSSCDLNCESGVCISIDNVDTYS